MTEPTPEFTPETMPPSFWLGIEQFNQGEFYACHDTLEALWMEAIEPEKTFYQGVLQIAVGFYHLGNHNRRGAIILLGEGMNRLRRYLPDFGEIDVAQLVDQSRIVQAILQQAAETPAEVDASLESIALPTIQRASPAP